MKFTEYEDWTEYHKSFEERFVLDESYVVCGVGESFHGLMEIFPELKIQYCLDLKAGALSLSKWKVYPYEVLAEEPEIKNQKFIIATENEYYSEIKRTLLTYGAQAENIACLREILFFWGALYHKKSYYSVCNVHLLTNCNLNCKGCSSFTPYIRHHKYNSVDTIKAELDQYFELFDYVIDLVLLGGETLLYRELGEVCSYIGEHFPGRYHELMIVTNGLIVPSEDMIREIGTVPNVRVRISDYGCSVDKSADRLAALLEKYQVRYTWEKNFSTSGEEYLWYDFGNPALCKNEDSNVLQRKFQKCSSTCSILADNKIYYCAPACMAVVGDIRASAPREYLDCNKLLQMELSERIERIGKFVLGFVDQGYLNSCDFCNGFGREVNTHLIKAGEQTERLS